MSIARKSEWFAYSNDLHEDKEEVIAALQGYEDHIDRLHKSIAAIEAERDALRKDAVRYRWLRDEAWGCDKRGRLDVHVCQFGPGVLMSAVTELAEEALDSAIDAAIAAKEPNRE